MRGKVKKWVGVLIGVGVVAGAVVIGQRLTNRLVEQKVREAARMVRPTTTPERELYLVDGAVNYLGEKEAVFKQGLIMQVNYQTLIFLIQKSPRFLVQSIRTLLIGLIL